MSAEFSRILVATDFGPESKIAFRSATSLAAALGASIVLLHVAQDPMVLVTTPELYGIDWVGLRNDIVNDAKARLATLAKIAGDVPVTCAVVVGRPAEAIVEAAAEAHASLIVMGTHGRGRVRHLLLGSVAERVIRLASCPVMTVRDSGAVHIAPGEAQREPATSATKAPAA